MSKNERSRMESHVLAKLLRKVIEGKLERLTTRGSNIRIRISVL